MFLVFTENETFAQDKQNHVKVVKTAYFDISPPLREMAPIDGFIYPKNYKKNKKKKVVNNHFRNDGTPPGKGYYDKATQKEYNNRAAASVLTNFDGANNGDNSGLIMPPDTDGDVGPNHYFQAVNNVSEIFDKSGNTIWGPQNTSVFWDGFNGAWTGTNDGDPIVLYDEQADRWLVSQFAVNTSDGSQWILIAVSTTPDPTGSYARYAYEFDQMPDYPKFGIWHDGYYMSVNRFTNTYEGVSACAFDRNAMLAGNPNATMAQIDRSPGMEYSLLPADCDGSFPAASEKALFVYDTDDDTYWDLDRLKITEFNVNWSNPSSSSLTEIASFNVTPFNSSFNDGISQPEGSKLSAVNDRMMFRANYRDFGTHKSIVVSRTVNTGGDVAAIRWYELRKTTGDWFVYQEGTYNPGDGNSRWMPSIAINAAGDIALGYSVSGPSTHPSIRVTGRYADDPLNIMTITETSIYEGTESQSGGNRWGDYSMMSVDENDDFWYTSEYSNGGWNWATRIAEFRFPTPCTPPTTQASNFSATDIQDNQMTLNWTRGNGDEVIVVARKSDAVNPLPGSGTVYTANSIFGSGDEIGSGNFVVYKGTGTSVTLTNLESGSMYHYAILEYFTADNCYNLSALTGNALTTGEASCTPCSVSAGTDDATGITKVEFNTISNTSSGSPEYTDNTSESTVVARGNTYELHVNVNTGGNYTVNAKAWIDWNHDCDFTDAGEEYDLGSAQNETDGAVSGSPLSITIPADALEGNTFMRIRAVYSNGPVPCNAQNYSEAEDYILNVIANANAPTATIEAMPECQTGSIKVKSNMPGPQVFYLTNSAGTVLQEWNGNATSHEFTGLATGTYRGKVKNNGTMSGLSSLVLLNNLKATEITSQPVSITDAEIGSTAVFSVSATGEDIAYQWKKDNSTIPGAVSDTYTISSVATTDVGTYKVEVSGTCGNVTSGDAVLALIVNVQTLEELGLKIYPNPNNGRFSVSFDKIKDPVKIQISNLAGRTIYYGNLNNNFKKLDIGQQAPGIYLMKIYDEKSSKTLRFIIK